jgi:hypothetical protein
MYSILATVLLLASPLAALPSPLMEERATCPGLPSGYSPAANSKLPSPFVLANGDAVTTKDQFTCKQGEISQLMQTDELGTLPPKPSSVTSSLSGSSLSITSTEGGKSMTFKVTINYPSSGTAPFPAIIAYGTYGASIPIPSNVATILFDNDGMAAQSDSSSRGQGLFYNLYGSSHSAGAMMAWAWGINRIMDAIEQTDNIRIDPKRVGITGCSRNGKGAFIGGAFEPRIALTIPQESGCGGAACWRVSDSEHNAGKNIQTASEIVGENVWFSTAFNSWTSKTTSLPYDHHELAALVAPRGLYVIENDIDWLGPVSTTVCMKAGLLVYQALGASDAMGFSLVGGHNHCSFPSAQQSELTAFINKYLLGQSANTSGIDKSSASVTMSNWVDWTVPTLS